MVVRTTEIGTGFWVQKMWPRVWLQGRMAIDLERIFQPPAPTIWTRGPWLIKKNWLKKNGSKKCQGISKNNLFTGGVACGKCGFGTVSISCTGRRTSGMDRWGSTDDRWWMDMTWQHKGIFRDARRDQRNHQFTKRQNSKKTGIPQHFGAERALVNRKTQRT